MLSADVERVSKENSALLEELARVKAAQTATNIASPEGPKGEEESVAEEPPRKQVWREWRVWIEWFRGVARV